MKLRAQIERPRSDHRPEDFFVLRTPLLAFDELLAWVEEAKFSPRGAEFSSASEGDPNPAILRERLKARVRDPMILEALFVSSVSLDESLEHWNRSPESKQGQKTERALVRYFQRMASRPTPFGMFSGCSVGTIGDSTRLCVSGPDEAEIEVRLDLDYLSALAEYFMGQPELRGRLIYRVNSTLYRAGDRWRFLELRAGAGGSSPHLADVASGSHIDAAIELARAGATIDALTHALVAVDPDAGIDEDDARAFVHELIDAQILCADTGLTLTGAEPLAGLLAVLRRAGADSRELELLERCDASLRAARSPGRNLDRLRAVASDLRTLPVELDPSRLFRVTMSRPAPALRPGQAGEALTLGRELCAALLEGVELLRRIAAPPSDELLRRFRVAFAERYGDREIPLVEALDVDLGVGLGEGSQQHSHAIPLLDGLDVARPAEQGSRWYARDRWLLTRLERLAADETELVLGPADIEALGHGAVAALPDAFSVLATLVASPDPARVDEHEIFLHSVAGPSGARALGRFCDGDETLRERVEAHLRAEEQQHPEAIFAEVVYMPPGKVGNVSRRPCLREYEIPYLGSSGAPRERQIPIDDLGISVVGDRVVLRSVRLGCEVIPRATTAHNPAHPSSLPLYRLLRALETQAVLDGLAWEWGELGQRSFLPRVRLGGVIVSRARWRLDSSDLEALASASGPARIELLRRWQVERRMPRFVACKDGDNELPIDFANELSLESFAQLVERRSDAILTELCGAPDRLCASDGRGRLAHEVIVPFVRSSTVAPVQAPARPRPAPARSLTRRFVPGSEWLTIKLYCGPTVADRVLDEVVTPWIRRAREQGAHQWHFLRYADPHWHLRVRLQGDPALLHGRMLADLRSACAPLLDHGWIWRVQLDTYEREVERYGGAHAIELVERAFEADSDAAVGLVALVQDADDEHLRWQLALVGIDRLLDDLGLTLPDKLRLVELMRASYGREFAAERGELRHQLSRSFRARRAGLEALLQPSVTDSTEPQTLAHARASLVLDQRSLTLRTVAEALHGLAETGRLGRSVFEIAASLVHMHAVRVLMSEARAQELVIHDYLGRLYHSRLARAQPAARLRRCS